ncbi:MAG TPA: hypothetical protein VM577_03750 [Anaerovoracaceae bacterium]|nr:hypothetical protein [Anaerovoracaceae bacterium]
MSEIESPLGKKTYGGPARRVLAVSDESEDFDTKPLPPSMMPQTAQQPREVKLTPEQFNEMQARRNEARMAQKKPTSEAKVRIELLTGIGRLTKDVVIGGYTFSLQSLKSKEMREVIKNVSAFEVPSESMYEMRCQILARSIVRIDDQPVGMVLGSDSLDAIAVFIDESEESTVNKLFSAYNEMVKSIEETVSVKTPEDAKEVAEAIKK